MRHDVLIVIAAVVVGAIASAAHRTIALVIILAPGILMPAHPGISGH